MLSLLPGLLLLSLTLHYPLHRISPGDHQLLPSAFAVFEHQHHDLHIQDSQGSTKPTSAEMDCVSLALLCGSVSNAYKREPAHMLLCVCGTR